MTASVGPPSVRERLRVTRPHLRARLGLAIVACMLIASLGFWAPPQAYAQDHPSANDEIWDWEEILDSLRTPCDRAIDEYREKFRDAEKERERTEELVDTFLSLLELVDVARDALGDDFKPEELFDHIINGTLRDFVHDRLSNLTKAQAEKFLEKLTQEALDNLLGTANHGTVADQMRELQRILGKGLIEIVTGQRTPLEVIVDVQKWVLETVKKATEVLDGLMSDVEANCSRQGPSRGPDPTICPYWPNMGCADLPQVSGGDGHRSALGKGEPHITTFDGLSYDFQGVGEYTLARGEDLEVQVRYSNLREGAVSVAVAVAARLPGSVAPLSVYVEDVRKDGWHVYVDDDPYVVPFGQSSLGEYVLTLDGVRLHIETDGLVGVDIFHMETNRPLFNIVRITVNPTLAPTLIGGLYGDIDDDPSTDYRMPDGTVIPIEEMDFETLYKTFGEAWRVKTVEESLFRYDPGTEPSTFHNPRFPSHEVTLSTLSEKELLRGLRPCLEAGVWIEPALSECVFDVAITDDDLWVQTGTQSQQVLPKTAAPLALADGAFDSHGTYILWEHQDFVVRGLIAGDASGGGAQLAIRALQVSTDKASTFIYPGWKEPPPKIDLPGNRELKLVPWGRGVILAMSGPMDDVGGLATAQGQQPDIEGWTGLRLIHPDVAQRWQTEFPAAGG